MKYLRLGGASVYLQMRDNETQDEAVDRLFDIIDSNDDIDIVGWREQTVEQFDDDDNNSENELEKQLNWDYRAHEDYR